MCRYTDNLREMNWHTVWICGCFYYVVAVESGFLQC
jgi:hypothetical protein